MRFNHSSRTVQILLLAFIIIFYSDSVICAPNSKSKFRIINGISINSASVPIVELIVTTADGVFLCSGTMIAPNVVLTASHCVTNKPSQHLVYLEGKRYSVSKVKINPNAKLTAYGLVYDIALLYLKRNPKSTYFPIITSRSIKPGDPLSIFGYGLDNHGYSGRLLGGSMSVNGTDQRWIYASFDGVSSLSNTCSGDSGGPAFGNYINSDGQTRLGLVGVTSGGFNQDCSIGDESYFTNLQGAPTIKFLRKSVPGLIEK